MALISAVAITVLNPADQFKKASDGQRKSDLAQIQRGLESYYQDHGRYPSMSGNKIVRNGIVVEWGNEWQPYMNVLPKDPEGTRQYSYWVDESNGGQTYRLYASLARPTDDQLCNGGNVCTGAIGNGVSGQNMVCGGICNYGVTSPNISP